MITFNDFLGQEVKVGDHVTFNTSGAGLTFGIVQKITPKQALLRYADGWSGANIVSSIHKTHDAVALIHGSNTAIERKRERLRQALLKEMSRELVG